MDESKLVTFSIAMQSVYLLGVYLPPVSQLATSYQTDAEKRVIREAEIAGCGFLLILATIVSISAKDPLPLVVTSLVSASLFATYEYALAREPA